VLSIMERFRSVARWPFLRQLLVLHSRRTASAMTCTRNDRQARRCEPRSTVGAGGAPAPNGECDGTRPQRRTTAEPAAAANDAEPAAAANGSGARGDGGRQRSPRRRRTTAEPAAAANDSGARGGGGRQRSPRRRRTAAGPAATAANGSVG